MTDTTAQEFNLDAFMYGVRRDSPFDGSTLADSISDDEVRRADSTFNSLLKRAEKAEKSNAFLKEQLAQLANFNPDWDMLEACRESWREVVALLKEREAELAALKGDQVPVAYLYSASFERGEVEGQLTDAPGCDMPVYDRPQKPVVLPQPFTVRSGHPFNEGERTAMIPDDNGNWLSKFDVEHAIKMAGGIVKDGE